MLAIENSYEARLKQKIKLLKWQKLHLDPPLLLLLLLLSIVGLLVLYSASDANSLLLKKQLGHFFSSFALLFIFAQIPPHRYQQWSFWFFALSTILLLALLFIGHVDLGAKRCLSLGFMRFQPSEMMKLAMPLMIAWYLKDKSLPPSAGDIVKIAGFILLPTLLIMKQPDLGTAILVALSGFFVLLLAGIRWRLLGGFLIFIALLSPLLWRFMHHYQKERVLTFLNPERDPLGSGYHIIQSKIAIGSGGLTGKGWLEGTQSHLSFLPAHTTDFIFAVSGEEFGFLGSLMIILLLLLIFARCVMISVAAQDNFTRLLSGSLTFIFITSAFINLGMVTGILPVVGIPLPFMSYGGSDMMTLMIGFGMLMSVQTHRRLWSS